MSKLIFSLKLFKENYPYEEFKKPKDYTPAWAKHCDGKPVVSDGNLLRCEGFTVEKEWCNECFM
jgi:hypothetical protein